MQVARQVRHRGNCGCLFDGVQNRVVRVLGVGHAGDWQVAAGAQVSVLQALHPCSGLCVHSLRRRRAAGRGRPDHVDGAAHAAAGPCPWPKTPGARAARGHVARRSAAALRADLGRPALPAGLARERPVRSQLGL